MEHKSRLPGYSALAAALVFCWQWTTVHANYGGNWTALYCTGGRQGVPATLAAEHIYQFPGSYGFDGQAYHYVAHDPLMRTPDLKAFVDAPWLRYRRILTPGLAYLLAAGRAQWVDPAYYALILIFIGAGVYWMAAWCQAGGRSPAWGLLFLLLPATLISMDRMVTDGALAALAAAFAWYARTPSWRLWLAMAAAALARETGFLLPAAYCGYLLLQRRPAQAALFSTAAVPALAWYAYVQAHAPVTHYPFSLIPLSAMWANWLHPLVYPAGMPFKWLAALGDRLAMAGMLAAFGLALYWNLKRKLDPVAVATLLFTFLGLFLQKTENWTSVYDYGRVYSPVLLFLGLQSIERRSWAAVVPMAMILPRVGMQLGPQLLGVLNAAKTL